MSDSVIHINVCCQSKFSEKINAFIATAARKEIGSVELKGLKAFYTTNLILYLYAFYLENSVHELSAAIFSPKLKYPFDERER